MRHLLAVVFVAVLFVALGPAAPVPKHLMREPVYYYPTRVGTKWVYKGDIVLVVSKVEDRNGTKVVTVERVNGDQRTLNEVVEVSATGLVRTECVVGKLDQPFVLLKAPFKTGEKWTFDHPAQGVIGAIKGTDTIAGIEHIKVPAGTFEAVRVDSTYTLGEATTPNHTTAWYAPNVGLVKMSEGDRDIWLLESFTPAK